MQHGTWLVVRCFSDKPRVLTRHSGVSYACLLVPVVGIICHGDHLTELFGIASSLPFTARISKLWISRGIMVRHFSPEQYEV